MSTIESLVIAIGADPTGLKRGLAESNASIAGFVRQANTELNGLTNAPQTALTGYKYAQDLLKGLTDKFNADKAGLREQFARGLFDEAEFRERGFKSAQGFNSALVSGLSELRGRGLLLPEVEQQLQNALKDDGFRAGDAFVKAAQAQMAKLNAPTSLARAASGVKSLGGLVDDSSGRFTSLGQRGATALRSVEFGLEQIVSGAGSAEGAARGALRGASTFAEAFGPVGIVVSAVSAAGLALYSFWNSQRDEAAKTAAAFKSELAGMFNAGDIAPLQKRLQEIQLGRPSINAGIEDADPAKFLVKGGLDALKAQLHTFEEQYDEAVRTHNVFLFNTAKKGKETLAAQIKPIQDAYDKVRLAIFQVPSQIGNNGELPTVKITVKSNAHESAAEFSALSQQVTNLVGLFNLLSKSTLPGDTNQLPALADQMAAAYHEVEATLARQATQYNAQATHTRAQTAEYQAQTLKLREQLELLDKSDAVRVRLGQPIDLTVTERPMALLPAVMPARMVETTVAGPAGLSAFLARLRKPLVDIETSSDAVNHTFYRLKEGAASFGNSLLDAGKTFLRAINPLNLFSAAFDQVIRNLAPVFTALQKPLALLAQVVNEALTPIFNALAPVIEALIPPIRAILQVLTPIIVALIPVLKIVAILLEALFPIIKAVAIAFTYLAQIVLTAAGYFAKAIGAIIHGFGEIVLTIAKAIDKLPGVSAQGAIKFAKGIVKFGDALTDSGGQFLESAKEMARARKEIEGVAIDHTATALDGLGDVATSVTAALRNVPDAFKVARAVFDAADPRTAPGGAPSLGGALDTRPSTGTGQTVVMQLGPGSVVVHAQSESAESLTRKIIGGVQSLALSYGLQPANVAQVFALDSGGAR